MTDLFHLVYLLLVLPPHPSHVQTALISTADTTRIEAINVLQGGVPDTFLSEALIQDVAKALRLIRAGNPSIRDIDSGPNQTELYLHFEGDAWKRVVSRIPAGAHRFTSTGLPSVDTIAARLHVTSYLVDTTFVNVFIGRGRVIPQFKSVPNVPILADIFMKSADVEYAGTEMHIGGGHEIRARVKGATITISFYRNWGDCPAGCTHSRIYDFAFDRNNGRIRKIGERGDQLSKPGA